MFQTDEDFAVHGRKHTHAQYSSNYYNKNEAFLVYNMKIII